MPASPQIIAFIAATFLLWANAEDCLADERPNIIVIMADDLGYSDTSVYGGEIETPNIAALAADGIQFTNFYAGPTCGPSRAMLMSGADHHIAGMAVNAATLRRLPELRGRPGYEGYLNERARTIAARLQEGGYRTYMAGKWDLGAGPGQLPPDRGFDRSFSLGEAGASHFADRRSVFSGIGIANYHENGVKVDGLPEDFFSSTFYTDKLIEYIRADAGDDKPFFAYLAFTAPHWPLQAPDEWLDRYAGRFDAGWDELRRERLARIKDKGLLPEGTLLSDRLQSVPPWEALSPTGKTVEARTMEIYAAMVAHMDAEIGRFIQALKDGGEYDNSFIIFLSDNGAEGNDIRALADNAYWIPATYDNRLANMGQVGSYLWQGRGFAQLSVAPLRNYKSFASDGGVRVPAIVAWPGAANKGNVSHAVANIRDISATALALAGVDASPREGYLPITGRSMLAYLRDDAASIYGDDDALGFEAFGSRAIRKGPWKITWTWPPYGPGRWELFNIADDPSEQHDLSSDMPDRLAELVADWERYVDENGIVVFDEELGYGR